MPDLLDEDLELARIDEALYLMSRRYGRVILLLDRFNRDPLAEAIATLGKLAPECLPLNDPIFKDDPSRAPLLVALSHAIPDHHGLLQMSIEVARKEALSSNGAIGMCGWLFADAPLDRLRNALSQRLTARYPSHSIYFRFFDPRVMPRLAPILTFQKQEAAARNSSFADLLGPVATWCQLDRQGRFLQHDNPAPTNPSFACNIHFDDTTAAKIDRIEVVNLVVRQLAMRNHEHSQSDDGLIDGILVEAIGRSLSRKEDQVAYAWRAARYGKEFTEHARLQQLIVEAATLGIPLDYLLQDKLPDLV